MMKTSRSKLFCWLLLVIFIFNGRFCRAQISPLTLEQTVAASGFIFSGKITNVWSEREALTGFIVTYYTVAIDESIRGVNTSRFTFKQYGGIYKGQHVIVADMSYFTIGEEVVAFLYPLSKLGLTSPVGISEGKWNIQFDSVTGKKFVVGNPSATKIQAPDQKIFAALPMKTEYKQFMESIRALAASETQR